MTLDATLFTFAYDVVDEGAATVVEHAAERAGVNGVLMAVTYHDGRDLFPHGRSARIRYLEPGSTFFKPDLAAYAETPIKPRPSELARHGDPLQALSEAAGKRELSTLAWTVYLHHDRIGEHLEFTPRNAFGDHIRTDFCASNPAVRAYARALTGDVARRGVSTVLAEAVQFFPLAHGLHHERYFLDLGPRTRFLLGLCFCDSCLAEASGEGIDGARLRAWARREVQQAFDGDVDDEPGELSRDEVAALAGGDLGGYLAMRERVVATLTEEISDVARAANVRLAYLEPSGATKGYATGKPVGLPSPSIAWQAAVDFPALARAADEIEILGYAADVGWVAGDITAYRSLLGDAPRLAVALRPTSPDCTTVENLRAKVELALAAGVTRLDFYHYGLMRLDALDRIRLALGDAVGRPTPTEVIP